MSKATFITVDPDRVGGKPCFKESRIPVATLIAEVAEGDCLKDLARDRELNLSDLRALFKEIAQDYELPRADNGSVNILQLECAIVQKARQYDMLVKLLDQHFDANTRLFMFSELDLQVAGIDRHRNP